MTNQLCAAEVLVVLAESTAYVHQDLLWDPTDPNYF